VFPGKYDRGALSNVVVGMKYKIPWGYAFLIYERIQTDLSSTTGNVPNLNIKLSGTDRITTDHTEKSFDFNLNNVQNLYASSTTIESGETLKEKFDPVIRIILWGLWIWAIWLYLHKPNNDIV